MADSAFARITRLGHEVGGILAALDIDLIGTETAKTIKQIKQLLVDARLDVRDFEMSDNREEMVENAKLAEKRIEKLRAAILLASEHGIFSAIDIAQLSAQLDGIIALLR